MNGIVCPDPRMVRLVSFVFFVISASGVLAQQNKPLQLFAVGDQEIMVRRGISLEQDCKPNTPIKIAIIKPPKNGTLSEASRPGYSNYTKENPRFACNSKPVESITALYRAKSGFKGRDRFEFAIVYHDGTFSRYAVDMTVW